MWKIFFVNVLLLMYIVFVNNCKVGDMMKLLFFGVERFLEIDFSCWFCKSVW